MGDTIINSALLDGIRKVYPNLPILVFATEAMASYWESNPIVEQVVTLPLTGTRREVRRALKSLGQSFEGKIDVVLSFDPIPRLESFLLLDAMKAKVTVGLMKHEYRLFDISLIDVTYGIERKSIAARIENMLKLFRADSAYSDLSRHVPVDSSEVQKWHFLHWPKPL